MEKRAQFEACFAKGLDLTEFSSSAKSTSSSSHAAALLRTLERENRQKELEERNEATLRSSLQKRADRMKKLSAEASSKVSVRLTCPHALPTQDGVAVAPSKKNSLVSDVLTSMHVSDKADPRFRMKASNKKSRRTKVFASSSAQKAVKKGRKAKY